MRHFAELKGSKVEAEQFIDQFLTRVDLVNKKTLVSTNSPAVSNKSSTWHHHDARSRI